MKNCTCQKCGMQIKPVRCGKCDTELLASEVEKNDKKVRVLKCPKCNGMIKSPQCCGEDMQCSM